MKKSKKVIPGILLALLVMAYVMPVFATEKSIVLNKSYSGTLTEDAQDRYFFSLEKSGSFEISVDSSIGHYLSIFYYDKSTKETDEVDTLNSGAVVLSDVTGRATDKRSYDLLSGDYLILIDKSDGDGTYSYTTKYISSEEDFVESLKKKDDTTAKANAAQINRLYNGFFAEEDDQDCYKISVSQKGEYTFLTNAYTKSEWVDMTVYDSGINELYSDTASVSDVTGRASLDKTLTLNPGTYYVMLKAKNTGKYNLSINGKSSSPAPVTPTVSSVPVVSSGPSSKPSSKPVPTTSGTPTQTPISSTKPSLAPTITPTPTATATSTVTPTPSEDPFEYLEEYTPRIEYLSNLSRGKIRVTISKPNKYASYISRYCVQIGRKKNFSSNYRDIVRRSNSFVIKKCKSKKRYWLRAYYMLEYDYEGDDYYTSRYSNKRKIKIQRW